MGKRGKKLLISHDDRLQEMKNHTIFNEQGRVKKLSDPVWSLIFDNLNKNQPTEDKHIYPKNLQSYVLRYNDRIKLELNISESKAVQESKEIKACDVEKIEKSLISISNNVLYKPIVQELAFYPFSICHGATLAIDFASDLSKNTRFIFTLVGSFCNSFISTDTKIYLYSFGTIFFNQFVPIAQISAESISSSLLNNFLNKLLMNGLPIPCQVTVHHLPIHYTSMNSCFNINVTYENYLNICFTYLTENSDYLPRCVINTNIKLLILKVRKWDCIQNKTLESVRLFYLYCIIMLSHQYNINKFQDFLQKIFVVTYSQFQNECTKNFFKDIMSEIKRLKIDVTYSKKNIADIENSLEYMSELENTMTKYINYSECTSIYNYLTNTFAKAKQYTTGCDESDSRNAYYNAAYCKSLIHLCMEFVLWSKVMLKDSYDFHVEENEFALIDSYKNEFLNRMPDSDITIDEYLLENIDYVNNILETAINFTTAKKVKTAEIFNPEISHMYHEKNWMGFNRREELQCSSSSEDSEDSANSDVEKVSSEDECNCDEIEFSETDVDTLITSICESLINDSIQTKIKNEKEDTNLDTKLKDNIMTLENTEDMDNSYVHFGHDTKIFTSSPGVHDKKQTLISLSKDTLPSNLSQSHLKDTSMAIKPDKKGKTKRGKYLQPCEQIHLLNQKPLGKPKNRKVVKNYNEFIPKKINGVKQVIKTSSYFDCIIEIFTTSYYTVQKFQDFIKSAYSEFATNKDKKYELLAVLYNYATTFNMRTLYSARVTIIANICNASGSCYTWTTNIGQFYEKLMGSNLYKKMLCKKCNIVTYQHYNRIHLTREQIINVNLSTIIYNLLKEQNYDKCGDQLELQKLQIDNILCLDIENLHNTKYSNMNSIELSKLIPTISIESKTLLLVGIVTFEEPIRNTDSRHYIAYCRSVEGSWYEYNDCNSRNGAPKVKDNLKFNVALLFYAELDI